MSVLPQRTWLWVTVVSLSTGCFGEASFVTEGGPGAALVPELPETTPEVDPERDPDPDPGTTWTYRCDTTSFSNVTEEEVAQDFAARVHPLLTRAEGGCIGCHAASDRFRITDDPAETFAKLRSHSMLSGAIGGMLGRLTEANPQLRMPKDQPAWTDSELETVGQLVCKLSAIQEKACATVIEPGAAPLRRLTPEEYNNTVAVLLGDTTRPGDDFPGEAQSHGFNNNADVQRVDTLRAEKFLASAEALSAAANLSSLAPCALQSTVPADCGSKFITTFGERAFRGPVPAEQVTRLKALYEDAKSKYGAPTAIRMVLTSLLISPRFLYRVELSGSGASGEVVRLSSWEMASRLSYLFWRTMPDDLLMEAARNDALQTPEQIEAQARRLLADPKANPAVVDFQSQWLELGTLDYASKDPSVSADFETLKPLMKTEARKFYADVFAGGDARKLFLADYSFMNKKLADFYGVTGPTDGTFVKVSLNPAERLGVLSQAAFLAGHAHETQTDPVNRGRFVRERLLCQPLASPPPSLDIEAPAVNPNSTTRERFEQHRSDSACASCHQLMDTIGFGFENFDAAGKYRDEENGLPIDASGALVATRDADGTFVGTQALAQKLSESTEVRDCIATQYFRYSFGRAETSADTCSLKAARQTFADSQWDLRELLVALTRTDTFQYRRIEAGGTP